MREVYQNLKSKVKGFTMKGFLFRRTTYSRLLYVLDLTLTALALLLFCLALTMTIVGTVAVVILTILEYV